MAAPPDREAPAPPRSLARRLAPLAVLVAILVLFFALGLDRYVSVTALREHRDALAAFVTGHGALAGLIYVAIYAVAVAASVPGGAVMSIAGGFLFGTVLGALYVVIGATLGATALFLAARSALGDWLRQRLGKLGERMATELHDNAFGYLLVLRLVPLFPFWVVNLVPAFAGVSLRSYVTATFLGIIPASVVFTGIGSSLGAAFKANAVSDLVSWRQLLPLVGLAVLALIPVAYRRWQTRGAR